MGALRVLIFPRRVKIIAAFGMDLFISSWSLHYYEFLIGFCANTNRQIRRTKISVSDRRKFLCYLCSRKIPRDSPKNSLQDAINFICASQRIFEEKKKAEKQCISSKNNCNFKNIIKARFRSTKLMSFSDSSRHFQSFYMYFHCNRGSFTH